MRTMQTKLIWQKCGPGADQESNLDSDLYLFYFYLFILFIFYYADQLHWSVAARAASICTAWWPGGKMLTRFQILTLDIYIM